MRDWTGPHFRAAVFGELQSPPKNINRLEIAFQDLAGFALEPILDNRGIDLSKIGMMLEISILKFLQTR